GVVGYYHSVYDDAVVLSWTYVMGVDLKNLSAAGYIDLSVALRRILRVHRDQIDFGVIHDWRIKARQCVDWIESAVTQKPLERRIAIVDPGRGVFDNLSKVYAA